MKKIILVLLILPYLFFFSDLKAQEYNDLTALTGHSISAYYSPGNQERTKIITERCEKAIEYISSLVDFKPDVKILVLNPEHWKKYTTTGPYGMPHYTDNKTLVVAAEDNPFWKSFIPNLDMLPPDLASQVKSTYINSDSVLSMMAFFDLLALHELGHGFHLQGGLTMHRLWMQELFSNIMLHTYIAENEPNNLPALELFPEMVVAAGKTEYDFTTLASFEERYSNMNPKNYGWYQCRLHIAGKNIYNAGGEAAFIKLWKALKEKDEKMTDEEFANFLKTNVHNEVASVLTAW